MSNYPAGEPLKESQNKPNELMAQIETAVGVLHNENSTAQELESTLRNTNAFRLKTSHSLEWCHIRGVPEQVQKRIRSDIEKELTRLGIEFDDQYSPLNFIHPKDRDKYKVEESIPNNGNGHYKTDTGEIGILAGVVGAAERAYPLLDFNYPSVVKHEEIHRLHWAQCADFLTNTTTDSSPKVQTDNANIDEMVKRPDTITVKANTKTPLAFVWLDEAWAYCNDTTIDGATKIDWQIDRMCRAETYCTFTPPSREYAETIVVLTAAAMEIGVTDVEFFDHLIQAIYKGKNSEAIADIDAGFDKRAFEEKAIIECRNFVLQKFLEKGIINPKEQDPLEQLNEYAKRFFIRAVLKREVADLIVQEALTKNLKGRELPNGLIVHEFIDDPSPDKILLPIIGEIHGPLSMNQLYLLISPNVDFYRATSELRSKLPYRIQLVDYDVAAGDMKDVSLYLPEGRPDLVNFKSIAKRLVDELPEADLLKVLNVGENSGTVFIPEQSGILHEIGNALITELALRGRISQREADIIIAVRNIEQIGIQYINYIDSVQFRLLSAAEFHSMADIDGNNENRLLIERSDLANVFGLNLNIVQGINPDETALFTITIPTQKALKLSSENTKLEFMDTIKFSTIIRSAEGDLVTIPEGIVYQEPMEMAIKVVNALSIADCESMSIALREGKIESSDPEYDEVTGKAEFIRDLKLQISERLKRENKPINRLKRFFAKALSQLN